MNALIFVVIAIIRASLCISAEKIDHFVLVKRHRADVFSPFLVIIVKFTALAIRDLVFHITHIALLPAPYRCFKRSRVFCKMICAESVSITPLRFLPRTFVSFR